ncbi:fibrillin-2-like isoform X2 [Daktulosphaira vitifoliae]|nr:fibrillin-2-like isoform X2 [Daktulosphaira vitifoliae]
MRQMNWTMENHSEYIHMVDNECLRLKKLDWTRPNPFRGPLDRFRWRVTASYFMCWYTMQNISLLSMFNEPCDDIGECYQSELLDFRSDNSIPYQCALYSFCPDPCCPVRRVVNPRDCDIKNPCRFALNNKCTFHRHQNLELPSVIYNEWNVSCICDTGYLWDSRYGMCIDVNECSDGLQKCDDKSETCINLPGRYKCICRWGYMWIDDEQACVVDISVKNAEIRFGLRNVPSIQKSESISIYSNFWNYLKNIYQKFTIFN